MFKLILVVALATLTLGAPKTEKSGHHLPDGRIIGGTDAKIEDIPYQLSLLYKGQKHVCGAVLVDEKWAITAGHCTDGFDNTAFTLRAGSDIFETGGQVVALKKIYHNPNFDYNTLVYDISVLELAEPIVLGKTAATIKLVPSNYEPEEGAIASVSGWGRTVENIDLPSQQLQVVQLPIVNRDTCNEDYQGRITETMICAGFQSGGKGDCYGDSGGPLVIDGKLAGLVSWAKGCAFAGYPGIYSNMGTLGDFARNVTGLDL